MTQDMKRLLVLRMRIARLKRLIVWGPNVGCAIPIHDLRKAIKAVTSWAEKMVVDEEPWQAKVRFEEAEDMRLFLDARLELARLKPRAIPQRKLK